MKRERPVSASGKTGRGVESAEEWEDKVLRGIFRLSLEGGEGGKGSVDGGGNKVHFVEGVKEELEVSMAWSLCRFEMGMDLGFV